MNFDEGEIRAAERAFWCEASWVSGSPPDHATAVEVRGMILWRKEHDGRWRVAIEHVG